ncbi:hypothetical protein Scep_016994 [Stephania cephalantha]|uniref:Cytochrome P450 n=1 Tax=Stephania cephalantha TaxID=152367 RepID=A0AAP0NWG9_9MAGN
MAEHLQLGITPTTTIFALLVALAIYLIIGKLIIKRKNHVDRLPLPPGPKPWPIIGNLPHLGSVPHSSLAEMARKYGPLMHLKLGSVHVVVAASASVASQFLKTHDANFAYRPPNAGAKYVAYNYRDLVFAPYSPRWRFLRKICYSHLFSPKALDNFHHIRQIIDEHQSGYGTESHKDLLSMLNGLKRDGNGDGEGDSLDDIEIKVLLLTFRLHPSTPLSIPHMSRETCEVNGYSIPIGSTLLVNVWAIARDPSIWSDSLEFRPERFLPGGAQANVDVKGNDFELIPFGAGRRICLQDESRDSDDPIGGGHVGTRVRLGTAQ